MTAACGVKPVEIKRGDTFGFEFRRVANKLPVNITGHTIRIMFRAGRTSGPVLLDVTVGNGITIVDAEKGIAKLDAFIVAWPAGRVVYDIEFGFAGTVVSSVTQVVDVLPDVTHV